MDYTDAVRIYKDRIRIFFILYYFSEPFVDPERPDVVKIFRTETRIQKIDFLLRNPDYLAYELLLQAKANESKRSEVKNIVRKIFNDKEPSLKRLEMEKFFFGAYEDIDDVVAFLKGIKFIDFTSRKSSDFKTIDKQYFIMKAAEEKLKMAFTGMPGIQWYEDRCNLIVRFFGDLSGSQLKVNQYRVDEYRDTSYRQYIGTIEQMVKDDFNKLYNEAL
ncbi:hypothetical protein [Taibaiella chishuiensis]|uniref:Uncharacterized protein n=1 Tax=Taibaiella chishuiensis TaxID=1434707 RepID=A0A2P8D4T3_9BACT|nr:hypothetical protein [Taibaiella chishuiensis]PSK92220.1 hypothetical protein B0I18_104319 [Taibaiella chishuiensis]